MNKDTALRLALEALTNAYWPTDSDLLPAHNIKECAEAITTIKAALSGEAQQDKDEPWEKFCDSHCVWTDHHPDCKLAKDEPVAWMNGWGDLFKNLDDVERGQTMQPLYTTPPQRKPLTDDEIEELDMETSGTVHDFVRAIEAAHGIKGEA